MSDHVRYVRRGARRNGSGRDDVRAAVRLDPVEHHHRQTQVGQRTVHQPPQLIVGPLHERAGRRRFRRRPRIGLDLLADRFLRTPAVLAGRDASQHALEHNGAELIAAAKSRRSRDSPRTHHPRTAPADASPTRAARRASPPHPHGRDGPRCDRGSTSPSGRRAHRPPPPAAPAARRARPPRSSRHLNPLASCARPARRGVAELGDALEQGRPARGRSGASAQRDRRGARW